LTPMRPLAGHDSIVSEATQDSVILPFPRSIRSTSLLRDCTRSRSGYKKCMPGASDLDSNLARIIFLIGLRERCQL
jgi:hypothetical protein